MREGSITIHPSPNRAALRLLSSTLPYSTHKWGAVHIQRPAPRKRVQVGESGFCSGLIADVSIVQVYILPPVYVKKNDVVVFLSVDFC